MKDLDKFSVWYQQRFNTMIEQPPSEVWNNISKELDMNDVWLRVDSKLNSLDRRKSLVKRFAYTSLLFLLFFIPGSVIFKTLNNKKDEIILADKKENRFPAGIISSRDYAADQTEKKPAKPFNYLNGMNSLRSPYEKSSGGSFLQKRIQASNGLLTKKREKNFTMPENDANTSGPASINNVNTKGEKNTEKFLTASIPTTLVSFPGHDSTGRYFALLASDIDSNFYSPMLPGNNPFHGFYSGGVFSLDNIWLLNQLTLDGLKANSLNQTKIDFGCSYGISAGYNFNTHLGGEMDWYINAQSGQTYNFYDEGKYETKHIRMDISVINLVLKYRNQAYNAWLNIPKSQNLLFGVNLCMLKKNKSNILLNDNDDDIDIYDDMDTYYKHASYGVVVGYEYEILAFHKIILSSALIGNFGINNIFSGDESIPESFNRTHAASLGLNVAAKYRIN